MSDRETPWDLTDQILHFPEGLPGFPHLVRFVVAELVEDGAFQELRSVEDPETAMIVCVPWLFFPDYAPVVADEDQQDLGLETAEDAVVFVPVTVDGEARQVTLNLLGPFVVNGRTRRGRQLVLADSDYPVRAPIELPSF